MAVLIDNFNRANANLEASATASGGGTWVHDGFIAGAVTISSNALAANTSDGEGSLYSADIGSADQAVSFVLKNTTANSFVVLRCTDRQNYVGVRASGANLQIFRRVAGSFTQVYSAAHSITANDVIEARVSGTQNIEVLRNGASIVSTTIGATLTGTKIGVHARQAVQNPFIDDFSAQPLAADQTITGVLFSNANGFYGATVSATYAVTGALYSDADTFYGSTVAATNTIAGSLYSDPDTFYAATISAQQNQTISGALFANDNAFYGANVAGPRDSGGSGNRRNINDDPDAFADLLKEWQERKAKEPEEQIKPVRDPVQTAEPDEFKEIEQRIDRLKSTLDRAVEAVFAAQKAKATKTATKAAEKVKTQRFERERQAMERAVRIAAEIEAAEQAYQALLDEEDEEIIALFAA